MVVMPADNFILNLPTVPYHSRMFYGLLKPTQYYVHLCCYANDNNGINGVFFKKSFAINCNEVNTDIDR